MFRFLVFYICSVPWMLTKKHISALVYVTITFIMLFGVQQLDRSYSVQRSWECEGQICSLHPTRCRCSMALTSIDFYNWHKQQLEHHVTRFYRAHGINYCKRIQLQKYGKNPPYSISEQSNWIYIIMLFFIVSHWYQCITS